MTSDKKLTIIRILIFTLLSYIPQYCLGIFFSDNDSITPINLILSLLSPAVAHILTRLITKEGFSGMYLRANLQGNLKYYAAGIIFAFVTSVLGNIILIKCFAESFSFSDILNSENALKTVEVLLSTVAVSSAVFFIAFLEEFGWRAYLTPKLEKLMPTPAALTVSGIIWGMWHAAAIANGFNFGTDYKFFPIGGFIVMSVCCIFYGSFLSWQTKRTNSVYPASICHSCVDTMGKTISMVMLSQAVLRPVGDFKYFVIMMIPQTIIGIAVFIIMSVSPANKKDGLTQQ